MTAYTKLNQFIQTSEQIGAFSAYVRRPMPHLSGMVAQFFGPNGEDSDSILALSLTKYLDAEVYVTVHLIKDANGVVMKENGAYPKISQFLGIIRRGKPNRGGMVAEFFATNGEYSDEVNELGKAKYQDCLVFVDIRGKLATPGNIPSLTETIDEGYANKVSQHEIKEYQKQEKKFKKLNSELYLGFLRQPEVLYKLGNHADFINWINQKGCCWPNSCNNEPVEPYEVKDMPPYFNYLVFCPEHLEELQKGVDRIPGEGVYLKMKNALSVQNWAYSILKERYSLTGKEEPDSHKIAGWAYENKLEKYLPKNFKDLHLAQ